MKGWVLSIAALLALGPSASAQSTPDFYKCVGRVSGEWNYGRAPHGCNASSFGSDSYLNKTYAEVIFNDSATRTSERERYVEELHAVIRDAAQYYIRKRKPSVTTTEVNWWTAGIVATAAHESYMSHYRRATDGHLKMMRGDSGHGHGLMQIDDRSHFNVIDSGTAWNLITNLTYAMDIFYREWERAPAQSCVGSATNWEPRVRSAWAAYNGGPGSICRWTNPNITWARNDRNFLDMLRNRSWSTYVDDERLVASIDVACLIEKRENCPPPNGGTSPTPTAPQTGVLYHLADGAYCALAEGRLNCVKEYRDAICLHSVATLRSLTATRLASETASRYPRRDRDRHEICRVYAPSLISVGSNLRVVKAVSLRSTPAGGYISTAAAGTTTSILDFELRDHPDQDRYYRIKVGTATGWIFAGDARTASQWAVATSGSPSPSPSTSQQGSSNVARAGETIRTILNINLRTVPDGDLILTVPSGANLRVEQVRMMGTSNSVYYQVTYGGRQGYIYSGRLLPTDTTSQWTIVVR